MTRRLLILAVLGSLLSAALLWLTDWPLGVPGEWTWDRADFSLASTLDVVLGVAVAVFAAAVWIGFAWLGRRRIASASRFECAGWLCGMTLGGGVLLGAFETAIPGNYPAVRASWVLYDRGASGYFYEAAHHAEDVNAYLAHYEALAAGDYVPFGEREKKRDVYHIGTHPPGLILLHRGLIGLCRQSPSFADFVLATQPQDYADAFTLLERSAAYPGQRLGTVERAALWLAVLLTHLIAAATVAPLFLLVMACFENPNAESGERKAAFHSRREGAWMTVAFWPLVPALGIFLPKSDALLPFVGLLFLWLWLSALRGTGWPSVLQAALAGVVMWGGLLLSLALLPVALFAVLLTLWETVFAREARPSRSALKRPLLLAAVALAVFAAAALWFWWCFDANLWNIWRENLRNHAAFYARASNPRSYGKWLAANAVELTLAVGFPVVLLAAANLLRIAVRPEERRRRENGPVWCTAIVVGLLWLSGKNMGEAGRLWLFLMPWLLWASAAFWRQPSARRTWLAFLAVQAAICLLTVLRVRGFHFPGGFQ